MSEQVILLEPEVTRHLLELERRFAERRSLRLPVLCFLDPTHECVGAIVRDISVRGVGLEMDRDLEAGTRLLLCLEGTARRSLYALAVRVVRSDPESVKRWIVGGQFIGDLRDKDLGTLLEA